MREALKQYKAKSVAQGADGTNQQTGRMAPAQAHCDYAAVDSSGAVSTSHLPRSGGLPFRAVSRKVAAWLRDQRGFNLIEVMVAVGILGLIGSAFMVALQTGTRTQDTVQSQVRAQNLVRAVLEDIRFQPYLDSYTVSVPLSSGYSITIDIQPFCNPPPDPCTSDNNIQKNTVAVSKLGKGIVFIEDLKVRK